MFVSLTGILWTIFCPSYFNRSRLYSLCFNNHIWSSPYWQKPLLRWLCYPSVKSSVCGKLENTLWHILLPRIVWKCQCIISRNDACQNYKSPIVKASICICSLEAMIPTSPISHRNVIEFHLYTKNYPWLLSSQHFLEWHGYLRFNPNYINYLSHVIEVGRRLWWGGSKTKNCHYLSAESSRLQLIHIWFSIVHRTNHKVKQLGIEAWLPWMVWSSYSSAYICKDYELLYDSVATVGMVICSTSCSFSTEEVLPYKAFVSIASATCISLYFISKWERLLTTPCLNRSDMKKLSCPQFIFKSYLTNVQLICSTRNLYTP